MKLNLRLASLEEKGREIVAPGLPPSVKRYEDFITDDRIEP